MEKIEIMLQLEGLKFISTPRSGRKRGGGCGIIADIKKYTLDKLDITNEHKLEICWGMLRPKVFTVSVIKEFIID